LIDNNKVMIKYYAMENMLTDSFLKLL